ncbi:MULTISPECIES: hypothetical protein [unclassified Caballeronia]|uniref:hypothetical protein n=1 Tax=unclassified Caballeronia TaxID=2646786 RepID=UPI00285E6F5B|nr:MULTISPECIES: hypothetical protein [unclassified Caballeronia]MDR5751131.1 hypothetical protein [Caballeronia sp. LZ024]MDR5844732.1 hypothetical protein [Caballeronia sp. LZ031]
MITIEMLKNAPLSFRMANSMAAPQDFSDPERLRFKFGDLAIALYIAMRKETSRNVTRWEAYCDTFHRVTTEFIAARREPNFVFASDACEAFEATDLFERTTVEEARTMVAEVAKVDVGYQKFRDLLIGAAA